MHKNAGADMSTDPCRQVANQIGTATAWRVVIAGCAFTWLAIVGLALT